MKKINNNLINDEDNDIRIIYLPIAHEEVELQAAQYPANLHS